MRQGGATGKGKRVWLLAWSFFLCLVLLIEPAAMSAAKRKNTSLERAPQYAWELAFQDEFDGPALNEALWETQFPWGRSRSTVGELQWYAKDVFTQAGSKLKIAARPRLGDPQHLYDSGLISTHKSFVTQYGRFEIRCKIPQGKGLWPAFWLLPTDTSWPPEIDVFEALGDDVSTVHMTTHWSDQGQHQQSGKTYSGPDFSADFHTFAVEWTPDLIVWYVDGVERHRVANRSPQAPMYLLANLAVGGPWPGAPNESTAFPATFEIDYIRAYNAKLAPVADDGSQPAPSGNDGAQPAPSVNNGNQQPEATKKNKNRKGKKSNKGKNKKRAKKNKNQAARAAVTPSYRAGDGSSVTV